MGELRTSRSTRRTTKGRRIRTQIANIHWITEKAREFQKKKKKKKAFSSSLKCAKVFDYVDHNKLWKILKEKGIPGHFTCLLRNLYAGQEATFRIRHGTMDWFKIDKEYVKAVYCNPAYVTYIQSTSCNIPGLMNHKLELKLLEKYQQPQIC